MKSSKNLILNESNKYINERRFPELFLFWSQLKAQSSLNDAHHTKYDRTKKNNKNSHHCCVVYHWNHPRIKSTSKNVFLLSATFHSHCIVSFPTTVSGDGFLFSYDISKKEQMKNWSRHEYYVWIGETSKNTTLLFVLLHIFSSIYY